MVWVYKIDFLFQPQVEAAAAEVLNIIAVRWRLLPRLQLHQPQGHHPLGQVCHQLHPDLSTQTVSFLRKTVLSGMKGSLEDCIKNKTFPFQCLDRRTQTKSKSRFQVQVRPQPHQISYQLQNSGHLAMTSDKGGNQSYYK